MNHYDVIIIGAGVVGCMIGRELSKRGSRVLIVERSSPGAETSSVSLGGLVGGSAEEPNIQLLRLLVQGVSLYDGLAEELYSETQISVERVSRGTICVAFDEEDDKLQNAEYDKQIHLNIPGLQVEQLSGEQVRELEPGVSTEVCSALYYPKDGQVNNVRLVQACIKSALLSGAELSVGTSVVELVVDSDIVKGVYTSSNETIYADWVIIAAGAWADSIQKMPPTGIIPSKGQSLTLRATSADTLFKHVLMSPSQFIVPRPDGELRIGSTFEFVGFDKRSTVAAVQTLLDGALRIAPVLEGSIFLEAKVGFRPCTKDGLPIIGQSLLLRNLLYATGHHKFGITLSPLTAAIITSLIFGESAPVDYEFISPSRLNI